MHPLLAIIARHPVTRRISPSLRHALLALLLAVPFAGNAAEPQLLLPTDMGGTLNFSYGADVDGDIAAFSGVATNGQGQREEGVFVFTRVDGTWQRAALLEGPEAAGNSFGAEVSVDGGTIAVGAPLEAVDGVQEAGAVHVFQRDDAGNWAHVARLVAEDPREMLHLGSFVQIEGNAIAAGALRDGTDERFPEGAMYVFEYDTVRAQWTQHAKLEAPAEYEPRVYGLYGALGDEWLATIALGADDVILYRQSDAGWVRSAMVTPTLNGHSGARVGVNMSIDGNLLAVLAPNNHDPDDPDDPVGRVHVYEFREGNWHPAAMLASPDGLTVTAMHLENGVMAFGEGINGEFIYLLRRETASEWPLVSRLQHADGGIWNPVALSVDTLLVLDGSRGLLAYDLNALLPGGVNYPDDDNTDDGDSDDGNNDGNGDTGDGGDDDGNDQGNGDAGGVGDDGGNAADGAGETEPPADDSDNGGDSGGGAMGWLLLVLLACRVRAGKVANAGRAYRI